MKTPAKRAQPIAALESTLAPTQASLLARASDNRLTVDMVFSRLAAIVEAGEPADAISASKLFFDVTTGRAPKNATSLNVNLSGKGSDRFFGQNAAVFERPPAPKIEE